MSEQEPRNFLRRILPELKKLAKTLFPFLRTALPLFFCALAVTTLVCAINADHLYLLAENFLQHPLLLALNVLPVLLVMLLLYYISRRMVFSIGLTAGLFAAMAIADSIKSSMRQEPLLPTDLTLAKEALAILKTFPDFTLLVGAFGIIFFLLLLILALLLAKGREFAPKARLKGIGGVLLCALLLNFCYASQPLYDSFPTIGNPNFQVNQYASRGLIYSFLHQANAMQVKKPNGYIADAFEALEGQPISVNTNKKPHIFMIMGEAFSDLSENEHISFEGYRDPLEQFKAICAEENAVSGHIAVPNYGGGTSNTEYDVLAACPTRYLGSSLPSYNFIHREFDALPRRLRQIGYDTLAIHPGNAWFYNRQNVYPHMGFDDCYFLEDSFDLEKQGYGAYISDEAAVDKIFQTFRQHIRKTNAPLFSFTVTIQNHGPYEKKYGSQPPNFSTDTALTPEETDLLRQYFHGVSKADEQLGRLWRFAKDSPEPIVLVYFGDHLPGFSNGMDFFSLLDYPIDADGSLEEQLALYQTPFLIWQNDAANELCDIKQTAKAAELPENGIISSYFLSPLLAELLGMDGLSPLFDYSCQLRKKQPVCAGEIYVDEWGTYTNSISEERREAVKILRNWQYYKLFDQKL